VIVRDAGVELRPDPRRVIADLFLPGESTPGSASRAEQVIARLRALPDGETTAAAAELEADFGGRHVALTAGLRANADKVEPPGLDPAIRLVLGAAFTAERAVEAASVCNPSAVAHPDQTGVPEGGLRVAVSLRSIGEGHVSAISFCTATIGADHTWTFDERRLPLVRAEISDGAWGLDHLRRAIEDRGRIAEISHAILVQLPEPAHGADIEQAISTLPAEYYARPGSRERVERIRRIARSTYQATFDPESDLSQRVLVPVADEERRGLEDARFTRFVDADGVADYRATYTAYDGTSISPRLLVTTDFEHFSVHRLTGPAARTKGMAMFPRPIGGRHLALTRSDGESILLAHSDDGLTWIDEALLASPARLWEVVQIGTCGPPIETEWGWLAVTHGVGPMRRYSLGAMLLDLDDPSRVLARLDEPLLEPFGALQDGYVPNVVYSCGGLVHDGVLWLPIGVGDQVVRVVSVVVAELVAAMTPTAGTTNPTH
jgi:predicted GH43/DUF377 family glycosyl hydrolase